MSVLKRTIEQYGRNYWMKIKFFKFKYPQLVVSFEKKSKRDIAYPYVTAIAVFLVIIVYAIVEVGG